MVEVMRICQLAAGLAASDGGPAYSVPMLVKALRASGHDVITRTLEPRPGEDLSPFAKAEGVQLHARATTWLGRRLGGSASLMKALHQASRDCDIIHTHGLWLMPNIYPARVCSTPGSKARLVHSIRGMLGPQALEYSRWKKRLVWMLMQRRALDRADCLHATAESEWREIRASGLRNPVAIIPNGIDLPDLHATPRQRNGKTRNVLSLGRLHRKKGLDLLLEAWAQVERQYPDWRLRIVGPAEEGHDRELRAIAQRLGLRNASIEGPLFGDDVLRAYRSSDLFVLPTRNENFAMTVAEALAAEVPVISTRGAPWSGLVDNRCGWWVDVDALSIEKAMLEAMSLDDGAREAMGRSGRAWMQREFGWDRVAREMIAVYEWLAFAKAPPECVRFD